MSNRVKVGEYRTALTLNLDNPRVCPYCHLKTVAKTSKDLREAYAAHGEDVEYLCYSCGWKVASHYYED